MSLRGSIRIPGDKSLTHRAFMLAGSARGRSRISGALLGEDCLATLTAVERLGARVERGNEILIEGAEWTSPEGPLDCGNSGTTMRLLSGLLASREGLVTTLIGDESLSRRPMGRVATPLREMGAGVEGETAPLTIHGARLTGIDYISPVASAQVKSACLLAGLRADGPTTVREPSLSRDHTERMLRALGATVESFEEDGRAVARVHPHPDYNGFDFSVPGDISSAAFWAVGAAIVPGSDLELREVGLNPSRTGLLDVLAQAGVDHEVVPERDQLGEPVGRVRVRYTPNLRPFRIEGDLVPRLIDEIPVLALLAACAGGETVIRDAAEMRVKETDRIAVVSETLQRMGANVVAHPDGMTIRGGRPLSGTTVDATGDHRIAMTFHIANLIATSSMTVLNDHSIATSYPDFMAHLAEALR